MLKEGTLADIYWTTPLYQHCPSLLPSVAHPPVEAAVMQTKISSRMFQVLWFKILLQGSVWHRLCGQMYWGWTLTRLLTSGVTPDM